MTKDEIHIISKDKEPLNRAKAEVSDILKTKGMQSGPGYVNNQSVAAFEAVVGQGKDPHDKTDNWMRAVFPSTLELVQEQRGGTIYHTHLTFNTYPGVDGKTIVESADLPSDVVVQYQSKKNGPFHGGKNTPFSYDPMKDYYTEPDSY